MIRTFSLLCWNEFFMLSDIVALGFIIWRRNFPKYLDVGCGCWALRLKFSIIIIVIANAPPLSWKNILFKIIANRYSMMLFFASFFKSNMLHILLTLLFATKIVFLSPFFMSEIIFSPKRLLYTLLNVSLDVYK